MIRTKYCLGIWVAFFLERASNNRADRNYLKPRLTLLMQLQGVWGEISNLYGSGESIFTDQHKSLPPGIRSPESKFTRYWDLLQLISVVYIAVIVPFRLGFDITISTDQFAFWFDVAIDVYFITDVILNFRLAYYTEDGYLETDRTKIRTHYLERWFWVDLVASIPFTWFFTAAATGDGSAADGGMGQSQMRMFKTVRMLRLLKMLRVTRIMKLLDRHAKYTDWTVAMSSFLTACTIMYSLHLLACLWYLFGSTNELGWTHRILSEPNPACPICPDITLQNHYVHALYTMLLMGDTSAVSAAEKSYAIFSYCVMVIIQGSIAGLMSQLMMSSRVGEQEYIIKLAQLKAW